MIRKQKIHVWVFFIDILSCYALFRRSRVIEGKSCHRKKHLPALISRAMCECAANQGTGNATDKESRGPAVRGSRSILIMCL